MFFPQPQGYAIYSRGTLDIYSTCFIDNNFFRDAPIIVQGSDFQSRDNYGTEDPDVTCQFLAYYESAAELNIGVPICTEYESDICLATLTSPTAPATKNVSSPSEVGMSSANEEMPTSKAIGNVLPWFAVAVCSLFLALGAFFAVKPTRQPHAAEEEMVFSEFVC